MPPDSPDPRPPKPPKTPAPYFSSENLHSLVRVKYPDPAYVLLGEVRDKTGYDSNRSADALAFGTWPSRGLTVTGFEYKSCRSDWLKELEHPEKAEAIGQFCDNWFIVGSGAIIKAEEVPAAWGWLEAKENKSGRYLALSKPAAELKATPLSREFLMSILRSVSKNYTPTATVEARIKAEAESKAQAVYDNRTYRLKDLEALEKRVQMFKQASGIDLSCEWAFPAAQVGAIVKAALDGNLGHNLKELERMAKETAGILGALQALEIFKVTKGEENA